MENSLKVVHPTLVYTTREQVFDRPCQLVNINPPWKLETQYNMGHVDCNETVVSCSYENNNIIILVVPQGL